VLLRRSHPIETVVAARDVELTRRGQGFWLPFLLAVHFI